MDMKLKKIICYFKGHVWGEKIEGFKDNTKIRYAFFLYLDHRFCQRCGKFDYIPKYEE